MDNIFTTICGVPAAISSTGLLQQGSADFVKQLVELWKAAGTNHGELWKYYMVVASAVLGFAFSDKFFNLQPLVRKALFFLFTAFLLSNIISIYFNFLVYNAATDAVRSLAAQFSTPVANSLCVTPTWVVVGLHGILDICALLIVGARAFHIPTARRRLGTGRGRPDGI